MNVAGLKASGEIDPNPAGEETVLEKKPNLLTQGLNTLAACVTPGLYAIVAGGMIKGIISLLTALKLAASGSDAIKVLTRLGTRRFTLCRLLSVMRRQNVLG